MSKWSAGEPGNVDVTADGHPPEEVREYVMSVRLPGKSREDYIDEANAAIGQLLKEREAARPAPSALVEALGDVLPYVAYAVEHLVVTLGSDAPATVAAQKRLAVVTRTLAAQPPAPASAQEHPADWSSTWRDDVTGAGMTRDEALAAAVMGIKAAASVREALEDMVRQFAHWSDGETPGYWTGGLSALEEAFSVLGWDDPHPAPEATCDEPGCRKQRSSGWPSPTGYRRTCGDHFQMRAALAAQPPAVAEQTCAGCGHDRQRWHTIDGACASPAPAPICPCRAYEPPAPAEPVAYDEADGMCPNCGGDAGDNWFDRSVCPDPCGYMHTRCRACGHPQEGCVLMTEEAPPHEPPLAAAGLAALVTEAVWLLKLTPGLGQGANREVPWFNHGIISHGADLPECIVCRWLERARAALAASTHGGGDRG